MAVEDPDEGVSSEQKNLDRTKLEAIESSSYMVGGAVRDQLLGLSLNDRDWVVVGSTQAQMLAAGFQQVGRDFPVFLHPISFEEYALARTERKQGSGHTGFEVFADPTVTLEEDLLRRDLTINAIALDKTGNLIDPFGGVADLKAKTLRHVSAAFSEDPLRVLRVARFAARLQNFTVASDTAKLMRTMVAEGALQQLSAQRVWQETKTALNEEGAARYFDVLNSVAALGFWFDELQGAQLEYLSEHPNKKLNSTNKFALLPLTESQFRVLAKRTKIPNEVLQFALDYSQWGERLKIWTQLEVNEIYELLIHLKVQHTSQRLTALLKLLNVISKEKIEPISTLVDGFKAVQLSSTKAQELKGAQYGAALKDLRIDWLKQYLGQQ